MPDRRRWVIDTSAYTHLSRAGHGDLIAQLAPGGVVLVPAEVNAEIENGRLGHFGIPAVADAAWAELATLSEEEAWTMLLVKAQFGGDPSQHLGECAVIACAYHRNLMAVIDEREAIAQADALNVPSIDTLWIVIEAYKTIFDLDRGRAVQVVDDLLDTGMYLPVSSGESVFSWAFELPVPSSTLGDALITPAGCGCAPPGIARSRCRSLRRRRPGQGRGWRSGRLW